MQVSAPHRSPLHLVGRFEAHGTMVRMMSAGSPRRAKWSRPPTAMVSPCGLALRQGGDRVVARFKVVALTRLPFPLFLNLFSFAMNAQFSSFNTPRTRFKYRLFATAIREHVRHGAAIKSIQEPPTTHE